ncbi:MAG: response regulator transcription factor [Bacteroidales bacterium]|nr:response regulator transcription factor [Bacteroidales bacterium]
MGTLKKIMLVDDDAVVRTGLRGIIGFSHLFEIAGEATNGVQFLNILPSSDIDFVILDLTMPGMYGTEVAKKALEIKPTLRIIIFSANVEKDELILLLEMGIFGYILKTEGFEQIIKALTNAANGLPYFSPELVGQVIQFNVMHPVHHEFTRRETEILGFMCKGLNLDEIAGKLFVSIRTIEKHRSNMLTKTRKKSTLELVLYAIKNGIISIGKIDYKSGSD